MFDELADGVFRRHYDFLSLNVGVVIGGDGVLVIDTRESHEAAGELAADIRTLTDRPVRWVVNTHAHWDHTFGNAVFPDAELWGHRACRLAMLGDPEFHRRSARRWMPPERHDEIARVEITPPTATFEALRRIDVGGIDVRLGYHGRGHTDNDVLVHAGPVSFLGDLIEEGGAPYMGDGYLLDWAPTLGAARSGLGTVIVPGHGAVVDRPFVDTQTADMARMAELLTDVLFERRTLDEAAEAGPFPEASMREGLRRGLALAGA